jgi:hypothetical protein
MCVSELQVKEIVHDEIEPIRQNVSSAKNWAIGLLLGLLTTMFAIGAWVGNIQNRVENVETQQMRFEERVDGKLDRIENLILHLTEEVASNN